MNEGRSKIRGPARDIVAKFCLKDWPRSGVGASLDASTHRRLFDCAYNHTTVGSEGVLRGPKNIQRALQ